jgi:hypothetical protein
MPDAFTHPGKLGDVIAVLPTVAANAPEPIDFWTSDYCRVLGRFLERQPFIGRVHVSRRYRLKDFRHGARPREVPVEGRYDRVVHLGFPGFPDEYVPNWIARMNGLRPPRGELRLQFAGLPREGVGAPYVACHFRTPSRAVEAQGALARVGVALWQPPAGTWDAAQFDEIAARVAGAAFFVGDFSCLSQLAALAGVPLLVRVEPRRARAVHWFRPPGRERAWYATTRPHAPLGDLSPYLMHCGVI